MVTEYFLLLYNNIITLVTEESTIWCPVWHLMYRLLKILRKEKK